MQKRFFRSFGVVVASGLSILIGCGTTSVDDEGETCRGDSECGADEVCQPVPDAKRRTMTVPSAVPSGMVAAPPCMTSYVACTDSSTCPAEQICWPTTRVSIPWGGPNCPLLPTNVCAPKCPTTACTSDEVCEASGECRLTMCDEEGAPACPQQWECDPTQAATEKTIFAVGAVEADSPNYGRDIQRGCARLRCDETGGFTCKDGWTCDSANATDPTGCVALSCEEIGHCADDELYICAPTGGQSRQGGTDVHGCAFRNCSEGAACSAGMVCDPDAAEANVQGCRHLTCEEGVTCPTPWVCDPASDLANVSGCVPAVGSGGTGGASSGGASSGGASSGGASTGGSVATGGSSAQGGSAGSASAGRSSGGTTNGTGGSNASGSGGSAGSDEPVEELGRCVAR